MKKQEIIKQPNRVYIDSLIEYFKGELLLRDLLTKFENISEKQFYLINHSKTLEELEECVRKNKIFNMNDWGSIVMRFEKVSLEQFTSDYLKCIYGKEDVDLS